MERIGEMTGTGDGWLKGTDGGRDRMGWGWDGITFAGNSPGGKDSVSSRMGVPPLSFLPPNGSWLLLGHVGDWNAFPGTPDLFSCFGVTGGSFSESTQ